MPESIRTNDGLADARPMRDGFRAPLALLAAGCGFLSSPASAQTSGHGTLEAYLGAFGLLNAQEFAALALTLGLLGFAVVTAILLVRTRMQASRRDIAFRDEILSLRGEADRVSALLMAEPQVLIAWTAAGTEPTIHGDVAIVGNGQSLTRPLAFGTWLEAKPAQKLEAAVETLRATGKGFVMPLVTVTGRQVEAQGRAIGDSAVLRLKDVSGIKLNLRELTAKYDELAANSEALRSLIEELPSPIWARDTNGQLVLANKAYAAAVEARDVKDAVSRNLEFFDRNVRDDLIRTLVGGTPFNGRIHAIAAGARRSFDVLAVPGPHGSAGIAVDVSEVESLRAEMDRVVEAHRRSLDQLATGVAIYGADRTLIFYNAAFRTLWDLDAEFLESQPSDGAVLDRLRSTRKLPEEQDFRQWKAQLHEAYRDVEPKEHMWHLPGGRALRVVTTPNPDGGITYLFEDVSERLDLARRYDALIKVQSETLDHFAEAVAVFGSDGRLRLFNPAFTKIWKLQPEALAERPHVEAVIAWCQAQHDDPSLWNALRGAVTAIDQRSPVTGPLNRRDGTSLICASLPLPDGATMVTFRDVTDSVNVERALRERNEALEDSNRIKVNFVRHVSYELRSPLTNIVGFMHFLSDPAFGPLTDKQREYLGYMSVSTNALLALTKNILDLATIEAGAMNMTLGMVDIEKIMQSASEGIQDRVISKNLTLAIEAPNGIGAFEADESRVRQVLFNLLSNAAGFSPSGGTITLAAKRRTDAIVFTVSDNGPGIPPEVQGKVFDWFETHSLGSDHRGSGLGLSLVRSFVELHGGTVALTSAVGQGTVVTCTFPLQRVYKDDGARSAA